MGKGHRERGTGRVFWLKSYSYQQFLVILHEGQRDGGTEPKNRVKSQLFWPGTEGRRDAALNLSYTALFGQGTQEQRDRPHFLGLSLRVITISWSFCMRDRGMEGQSQKNHVKSQFFWPGTKGQSDTALNLSDTALFGQATKGQRDRQHFLA